MFDVSQLDKSRDVREEQPENIWCTDSTLPVSQSDRSREAREVQP